MREMLVFSINPIKTARGSGATLFITKGQPTYYQRQFKSRR